MSLILLLYVRKLETESLFILIFQPFYVAEATASLMEASQQIESGSNAPSPMEEATKSGLLSVKGNKEDFPPFPLTHRDIILYALGGTVCSAHRKCYGIYSILFIYGIYSVLLLLLLLLSLSCCLPPLFPPSPPPFLPPSLPPFFLPPFLHPPPFTLHPPPSTFHPPPPFLLPPFLLPSLLPSLHPPLSLPPSLSRCIHQ